IFEFGTFAKKDFPNVAAFAERLNDFLGALPKGLNYAVEIRNKDYLQLAYFTVLARHNVAHVFNAWTRMPQLADQIAIPDAFTADFSVVRALLQHGRTYEQAVSTFEPYRGTPSTGQVHKRRATGDRRASCQEATAGLHICEQPARRERARND